MVLPRTGRAYSTSFAQASQEELLVAWYVLALHFRTCSITLQQAKTVVAPLDRVKILFQASNPDFQKYAGTSQQCRVRTPVASTALVQGHGAVLSVPHPRYTVKLAFEDSSKATLRPYSVSSRTRPLNSWRTTR